jgi:hypothetical protein
MWYRWRRGPIESLSHIGLYWHIVFPGGEGGEKEREDSFLAGLIACIEVGEYMSATIHEV